MKHRFESIFEYQKSAHYQTPRELKYATDPGFLLSPYEYGEYLKLIQGSLDANDALHRLPLQAFDDRALHYCSCSELESTFHEVSRLIQEDNAAHGSPLIERHLEEIDRSRIYSEIEGSLNVEAVPTTRRRLKQLLEEDAEPENRNDVIVRNMGRAVDYVQSKPAFNKDNLRHLYVLLTEDCLDEGDALPSGSYYRNDGVEVDGYHGCPANQIEECMDSLFEFVRDCLENRENPHRPFLPHIAHYYILYVHPYFDYNGRTARMVSFWLHLLLEEQGFPPLISEAIYHSKPDYYKALRDTRDAHNDLTYFLLYLLKATVSEYLSYENLDLLEQTARNNGVILTPTELYYVRCILLQNKGAFRFQEFLSYCHIDITKQGALKILNKFLNAGILVEKPSDSRQKLFELTKAVIKY